MLFKSVYMYINTELLEIKNIIMFNNNININSIKYWY